MRIVTVVGARPQFIKAAAVSRVIRDDYAGKIEEVLVHTGQHYDDNMSKVFFDELDIPRPKYNLEISGGQHGAMTGRMLEAIENTLLAETPDYLIVYGDTNSTLAGALAAAKLHIPVIHIEAGLRSFNMRMPEEINRILTDRISSLLFCPSATAVINLQSEGCRTPIHNVGDVMYDVALYYKVAARNRSKTLTDLGLKPGEYGLVTCHRAENTDDQDNLKEILTAVSLISKQLRMVLPLHPRTRKLVEQFGLQQLLKGVEILEPLSFFDMVALEQDAKAIFTDSGGVQKEAFFYGVPCITMRTETEWVETITARANVLTGPDHVNIFGHFEKLINGTWIPDFSGKPYGDGTAATKIIQTLLPA